jgi:predicted Zn-dependent protease
MFLRRFLFVVLLTGLSPCAAEEPILPPAIEFPGLPFPQIQWPSAFIPDIPWQPPVSRPDAKTPFAPKFINGNNIFTGQKEYWLADAVAGTELRWPKRLTDPLICNYLTQLTNNLGLYSHEPNKHYEIAIVDLPYANAFTAGGGRIYLTRGILGQVASEDELAGVIAHEIGHDNFHHAGRTLTRQFFWVIGVREVNSQQDLQHDLAKFIAAYEPEHNPLPSLGEAVSGIARADEQSADKAAFYFLFKAGYNPMALADYFRRVPDPTLQHLKSEAGAAWPVFWTLSVIFDSHPPSGFRATALDWESNFISLVPPESHVSITAFNAMKSRLKYLDEQDSQKAREARGKKHAAGTKPPAQPTQSTPNP